MLLTLLHQPLPQRNSVLPYNQLFTHRFQSGLVPTFPSSSISFFFPKLTLCKYIYSQSQPLKIFDFLSQINRIHLISPHAFLYSPSHLSLHVPELPLPKLC